MGENNRYTETHRKKKAAVILITVLVILVMAAYGGLYVCVLPGIVKALAAVICLALIATMIGVGTKRIEEIDGGEEDDLSKY